MTEAVLDRLKENTTVQDLFVSDCNGMIVRSTLDTARSQLYNRSITSLTHTAENAIKNIDPTNELIALRMRTGNKEIIISPENGMTLTVIQIVEPFEATPRVTTEKK